MDYGVTLSEDPQLFLEGFDDAVMNKVDEVMRSNAYYLAEVMKELTPRRTGETAESIGVDEAWLEYDVGSDSPVFGWLDQGTSGHGPIVPVNAKALHWTDEAGEHFAKYVLYVRGIEPQFIIDTAMEMAAPVMDGQMELALEAAWSEAHGGGEVDDEGGGEE
jgi:hypothetical protein